MRFKKILFFLFAAVSCNAAFSQFYISPGATVHMSGNALLYSGQQVINKGSLNGGTGTIICNSHLNDSNVFNASSALLVFTGAGSQNAVFGNSSLKKVSISKSSGDVNFLNNVPVISDTLLFSSGKAIINNNSITTKATAGGSTSAYVKTSGTGLLVQPLAINATKVFSVGNVSYNPVSITNKTGVADSIGFRVIDEVYQSGITGTVINRGRVKRTWLMSRKNNNGGFGYNITLTWADSSAVSLTQPRLYAFDGNNWVQQNGTYNVSGSSITYTGYTGNATIFSVQQNCQTSTTNLNVAICPAQVPYLWNGNSYTASGTYSWTGTNALGCDSTAILSLTVKSTSTSITNITACGSYLWNGVTYTSSGTYTKLATNAVGCDSIATLYLTLTSSNNTAPSAITGARNINRCDTLQNYSVLPMTGVTFTWTVTGTGNYVKTGNGTNAVVMVMKVAGTISVKATNACGLLSVATTLAVTKTTPTIAGTIYQRFVPTTVAANTNACLFTQTAFATTGVADTFRIRAVANATGYIWKAPTGSIVTRVNDTTIAVVFANTITIPDSIKVYTLSVCDTSLVKGLALIKTVAAAPVSILKTDGVTVATTDVCPNVGSSVTYKVRKVATAISYNWYMTRGTKATITHINPLGVNDTAIIVNYQSGFTTDSINVSCSNGCGTSAAKLLKVSAILLPPTPSTITANTGNFYPCPTNSVQYTVASPAATTTQSSNAVYRWTRPANTTVTASNADSSVITIRYESNYAGGSLSVKCQTACGIQGTAKTQALAYVPPTPTGINAGSGSYNVCIGSQVSFTCVDAAVCGCQTPITMHRWTRPNFTNIISATADSGTISMLIQTGFTGGNVTAKCQSPCGVLGTAKAQALTHTACPSGTKNINSNTVTTGTFEVNIFPNPTKSIFKLQLSSTSREIFTVRVLDVQGRLIKSLAVLASEINNIGDDLKSGVYMFEITQGKEKKTVRGVKY